MPRIAWLGRYNAVSSYKKTTSSTKFYYHTKGVIDLTIKNYTIWVPTTVLHNINGNISDGVQVVINEANKYNAVGLKFAVDNY
ncbi:MAG TPA: hypothetical protein VK835_12395 [Bacteroidia bacterium]|nr:hypothetical protein [Bacteroidia bacterium]